MPARRQSFAKDTPRPLRSEYGPAEFSHYQLLALGGFVSALLAVGHGVYANVLTSSGTIRLRIYADGETWEDNIRPQDDFAMLLGGYAKQFGAVVEYERILGAAHGGRAERPQETPQEVPEGKDTGKGGTRALRGS